MDPTQGRLFLVQEGQQNLVVPPISFPLSRMEETTTKVRRTLTVPEMDFKATSPQRNQSANSPSELTLSGLKKMLIDPNCSSLKFKDISFSERCGIEMQSHLSSDKCLTTFLSFVNCEISSEWMHCLVGGLRNNNSVMTLHFEACVLNSSLFQMLGNALKEGCFGLKTLNLMNIDLTDDAFHYLLEGIISQNNLVRRVFNEELGKFQKKEESNLLNKKILSNLCTRCHISMSTPLFSLDDLHKIPQIDHNETFFVTMLEEKMGLEVLRLEGCSMKEKGKMLETLITQTSKLKELSLKRNWLGFDKNRPTSSPKKGDAPNPVIASIIAGLRENKRLSRLNLSSNFLSTEDCKAIYDVLDVNNLVTIDITGNMAHKNWEHPRLINEDPLSSVLPSSHPTRRMSDSALRRRNEVKEKDNKKDIEEKGTEVALLRIRGRGRSNPPPVHISK